MREEGGEVLLDAGFDGSQASEERPAPLAATSHPLQQSRGCSCVVPWELLLWPTVPADDFAGGVGLLIWRPGPAPKFTLPSTWVARSESRGGTALPGLPCL